MRNIGFVLLAMSVAIWAVDVHVTTVVDGTVTFKESGGSQQVTTDFVANIPQEVSLSWATASSSIILDVISKNDLYNDTSFTTGFTEVLPQLNAWTAKVYQTGDRVSHNSKNWSAKWYATVTDIPGAGDPWAEDNSTVTALTIDLQKRTNLSADTAYIPITVNAKTTLTATALTMISGTLPSPIVTTLEPSRTYVLALPVATSISPVTPIPTKRASGVTLTEQQGIHRLALPSSYLGGMVSIVSLQGRQIGHADLTSSVSNNLSIWNVTPGIYAVRVTTPKGKLFSAKIRHSGGTMRLLSSFVNSTPTTLVGGVPRQIRASTAQYRFDFVAEKQNYRDSSLQYDFAGLENSPIQMKLATEPAKLEDVLSKATYEAIFPHRNGLNADFSGGDFYTYESFKEAIETLANYRATVYTKNLVGGDRVVVEYQDGSTNTYYTIESYDASANPETSTFVDYSTLLNWGTIAEVKYELVAMLAHIGSETTGRSPGAADQWEYGLYFVHEAGLDDNTVGQYVVAHGTYPAEAGESYHGRGPKQLSYNYNYGQFSDFLYGDKDIVLKNPNLLANDAVVSFMSSLWFWMTPQTEKPSCHMVMSGEWVPSADDIAKGRDISKFGMTTNIINGGVECGGSFSVINNEKRLGHYNFFATLMGITPESELSCENMKNYTE